MTFYIKRFSAVLFGFMLISFLNACSKVPTPIEGEQFKRLPQALNSEKFSPITEVFSLTCVRCREIEKDIPALQKIVQQDITKLHITNDKSAHIAAMFYYAAEMQVGGVPDHSFMMDLFEVIQMPADSGAEQKNAAMHKAFKSRQLISPFDYEQHQTEALLKRVNEVSILSAQSKIDTVPAIIVNGKYQILREGHDKIEDIAFTISYLLTQ